MIKVKFQGETGEDVRKQMLDFLGEGTSTVRSTFVPLTAFASPLVRETPAEPEENQVTKVEDNPTQEKASRKRRTREEIEAEKTAAAEAQGQSTEESPFKDEVKETPASETTESAKAAEVSSEITRAVLTPLVVGKGREGKKAGVIALFEKFGATGLPTLDASHYDAFHEELLKL